MGYGSYNSSARSLRATADGFYSKSTEQVFKQREVHESMDPKGLGKRECRDSADHPNARPIILALDLTGSMGSIPAHLVKDGLPTLMSRLLAKGIDASLCFIGVGDHVYDRGPLQVGQFESNDQALDTWLTRCWLEKGGGRNEGESYHLAWLFGARHTLLDCYDKRGEKGLLVTIGDEPCLRHLPAHAIKEITGYSEARDVTAAELLEEARKMYNVYHISAGGRDSGWSELIGQGLIQSDRNPAHIVDAIINLAVSNFGVGEEIVVGQGETSVSDNKPDVGGIWL